MDDQSTTTKTPANSDLSVNTDIYNNDEVVFDLTKDDPVNFDLPPVTPRPSTPAEPILTPIQPVEEHDEVSFQATSFSAYSDPTALFEQLKEAIRDNDEKHRVKVVELEGEIRRHEEEIARLRKEIMQDNELKKSAKSQILRGLQEIINSMKEEK